MFNKCLWLSQISEETGIKPMHILFIDDNMGNVTSARNAGYWSVLVNPDAGLDPRTWAAIIDGRRG